MTSPRQTGVGGLGYVSVPGGRSTFAAENLKSSREALKADLKHRLHFDDASVFERLGLERVPEGFVTLCKASFYVDNHDSITELEEIVANAERKAPEILEGEKKKAKETKMYKPLENIFSYIEQFPGGYLPSYNRHFAATDSKKMKGEDHMLGFPHSDPDFTCRDPDTRPADMHLWRHSSAFAEIKPTKQQGPKSDLEGSVLSLVVQSADYARLHMSARPFQLFTVGLLIFGSKFCAAIFDRGGVTFSPIHDMWTQTNVFIRVVRRMSCDMSPMELGQDPTVSIIPENSPLYLTIKPKALMLAQNNTFPSYIVGLGGKSGQNWVTIGPPLWVSVSLIGRGSVVWRVCKIDNQTIDLNHVYVMKSAWRHSGRNSESEIYARVSNNHPGLAAYEAGSDVFFPNKPNEVISVDALRGRTEPDPTGTPILHRLILRTLGRPIWDYKSEVVLLRGFRAALQGHKFLTDSHILHRDISAGNIMLSASDTPAVGEEGFLTDLEFVCSLVTKDAVTTVAHIPPVTKPSGQWTEPTTRYKTRFETTPAACARAGTVQFMAVQIMEASIRGETIQHQIHHDLESFVWVLAYAVWRRLIYDLRTVPALKELRDECSTQFHNSYGCVRPDDVMMAKEALRPLKLIPGIPDEFLSQAMKDMVEHLHVVMYLCHSPVNPVPLTYQAILQIVDDTIQRLGG